MEQPASTRWYYRLQKRAAFWTMCGKLTMRCIGAHLHVETKLQAIQQPHQYRHSIIAGRECITANPEVVGVIDKSAEKIPSLKAQHGTCLTSMGFHAAHDWCILLIPGCSYANCYCAEVEQCLPAGLCKQQNKQK